MSHTCIVHLLVDERLLWLGLPCPIVLRFRSSCVTLLGALILIICYTLPTTPSKIKTALLRLWGQQSVLDWLSVDQSGGKTNPLLPAKGLTIDSTCLGSWLTVG